MEPLSAVLRLRFLRNPFSTLCHETNEALNGSAHLRISSPGAFWEGLVFPAIDLFPCLRPLRERRLFCPLGGVGRYLKLGTSCQDGSGHVMAVRPAVGEEGNKDTDPGTCAFLLPRSKAQVARIADTVSRITPAKRRCFTD